MNKCKMLWSVAEIRLIGISNLIFVVKIWTIQVDRWSFEVWNDHSTFVSQTYKIIVSTLIVTMFPARERFCFSRSANYLSICGKFCHAGMVVTVTKSLITFVTVCHGIPDSELVNVFQVVTTPLAQRRPTYDLRLLHFFPSAVRRQHGTIIAGRDNFVTWTRMSCRNRDWQLYTLFTSSCIQCNNVN